MLFRMIVVAIRIMGSDWWRPWRSELLRWRMETYGVQDARGRLLVAAQITPAVARRFVWRQRRALWRFLAWASEISVESSPAVWRKQGEVDG